MNPLPCSPFPEPKFRPVCTPELRPALSFWSFDTLSSFKALLKPLRNRFWSDFGSKNGLKINPKSNQSQCRYSTSFFNSFFIQNSMVHQTPDLAKSLKNQWFFNIFAYSACYNLTSNLVKTSIHFDMKIDQKFIKNQSKKDIKLKVDFGNICFLIFARFQLDFGSILAPKWARFCCWKRPRKHYRAQIRFQRPSGPQLGRFWNRFGTIFGALKARKVLTARTKSTKIIRSEFLASGLSKNAKFLKIVGAPPSISSSRPSQKLLSRPNVLRSSREHAADGPSVWKA